MDHCCFFSFYLVKIIIAFYFHKIFPFQIRWLEEMKTVTKFYNFIYFYTLINFPFLVQSFQENSREQTVEEDKEDNSIP